MDNSFKQTLNLFWVFFKMSLITFGSGYVIVSVAQKELIDKRKWFTEDVYLHFLSIATASPGPIVVNLASLIGHQRLGIKGLIAGFFGSLLPSFIILLLIAISFGSISDSPFVIAIFKGLRPAVVGLILAPVITFAKRVNMWEYPLFIAVALLIYFNIVSAIAIIISGVIAGIVMAYVKFKNVKS